VTELRPLLESSDDEFERALLQSVRADLPSPAGLHDTALAIGLAASTAQALVAALPAAGSLGTAVGVHGASVAAPVGASGGVLVSGGSSGLGTLGVASFGAVAKSLLGGALVSFVALTALDQTRAASSAQPSPVAQSGKSGARVARRSGEVGAPPAVADPLNAPTAGEPAAAQAPTPVAGNRQAVSAIPGQAPFVDARPTLAAPTRAAFAADPHETPSAPGAAANASLAAEIRVLDQARAALTAGDTNRASQLLDAYAANRPSSTLSQEAALLRVRVLLNRGQRPAAAALARRIIALHPESAHVESLRRLASEP
jgi:TolA-binding protein